MSFFRIHTSSVKNHLREACLSFTSTLFAEVNDTSEIKPTTDIFIDFSSTDSEDHHTETESECTSSEYTVEESSFSFDFSGDHMENMDTDLDIDIDLEDFAAFDDFPEESGKPFPAHVNQANDLVLELFDDIF